MSTSCKYQRPRLLKVREARHFMGDLFVAAVPKLMEGMEEAAWWTLDRGPFVPSAFAEMIGVVPAEGVESLFRLTLSKEQ